QSALPVMFFVFLFFFFSSRRRHTRFSRDWSSDVCSSDLLDLGAETGQRLVSRIVDDFLQDMQGIVGAGVHPGPLAHGLQPLEHRSEERRVGKESRSRWAPCRQNKKTE